MKAVDMHIRMYWQSFLALLITSVQRGANVGVFLASALLFSLAPVFPVSAQAPENISAGEVALLPKYCRDTMALQTSGMDFYAAPQTHYWTGLMGKSFMHMHHYCWAIVKVRRALLPGINNMLRRSMIANAIGDHVYVIRNSPPNFVLRPEIFTKIGEAYLLLQDPGNALDAFNQAIAAKPDYAPPYDRWAEALEAAGNKKAALTFLASGLKHNPSSEILRARYQRLGGNVVSLPTSPAPSAPNLLQAEVSRPEPLPVAPASAAASALSTAAGPAAPAHDKPPVRP